MDKICSRWGLVVVQSLDGYLLKDSVVFKRKLHKVKLSEIVYCILYIIAPSVYTYLQVTDDLRDLYRMIVYVAELYTYV